MRITQLTVRDIRFPTSQDLSGSDAMNPDPDYSAAYVVLETDSEHCGHGLAFTSGVERKSSSRRSRRSRR